MQMILSYPAFYCEIKNDLAFNKRYMRGKAERVLKVYSYFKR